MDISKNKKYIYIHCYTNHATYDVNLTDESVNDISDTHTHDQVQQCRDLLGASTSQCFAYILAEYIMEWAEMRPMSGRLPLFSV